MIILCFTFLPNDRAQAIPEESGTTINLTPVADNIADVVFAPILTTVTTDCKNDNSVF